MGGVDLGELNTTSAAYIIGYVAKKMTKKTDPRLMGRAPEFGQPSNGSGTNMGGLGSGFMHEVASDMLKLDLETSQDDAPSSLRHGKSNMPLGNYLQNKLREAIGHEKGITPEALKKLQSEMHSLQLDGIKDKENPSLKGQIIKANAQKVLNLEAKEKLYKTRKKL